VRSCVVGLCCQFVASPTTTCPARGYNKNRHLLLSNSCPMYYYIHVADYTQLFIYNNSYSERSCVLPLFFNLHLIIFKIRKNILVSYTYITTITVMIFSYHIKLLSMNDLKEKLSIYLSEQSVIFALSYKLYT